MVYLYWLGGPCINTTGEMNNFSNNTREGQLCDYAGLCAQHFPNSYLNFELNPSRLDVCKWSSKQGQSYSIAKS